MLRKRAPAQSGRKDARKSEPFQHLGNLMPFGATDTCRGNKTGVNCVVNGCHVSFRAFQYFLVKQHSPHSLRRIARQCFPPIGLRNAELCADAWTISLEWVSPRFQSVPGLESRVSDTDLISAHSAPKYQHLVPRDETWELVTSFLSLADVLLCIPKVSPALGSYALSDARA
jgi:hypothetical protein